jgi:tRNA-2-methylthio-N6-dimethylallyladenosine synthase
MYDKMDINVSTPAEERERQEEYIGKCRVYVSAFQVEHGRFPKACVVTFGCQMNAEPEISETRINKGFYKTPTAKKAAGVFFF